MSSDGTGELLEHFATQVQIVDNPRRITSAGLNLALHASRGDIIVRMDAHTKYAPDYVEACLTVRTATGATNVGGPARTQAKGFWQQAIAQAFHSPFFSGGARFHDESFEGYVDTVPYGCWRREDLERLGGFDETLVRNQDDELNFRIKQAGGSVWQSPKIRSWYTPRSSLAALFRQYFDYGRWKTAVIRKHGRPAELRHVVPGGALLVGAALTATSFISPDAVRTLLLLVAVYSAISLSAAFRCWYVSRNWAQLAAVPLVFATVHLAYGSGLLVAAGGIRTPR